MTSSYRAHAGEILEVLAEALAPFVDEHMQSEYPNDDWIIAAATRMGKREPMLTSGSDPQFQLEVIIRWWGPVFSRRLSPQSREVITELRQARNDWAHIDETHPIDLEYARRILRLSTQLLTEVGSPDVSSLEQLGEGLEWTAARIEARESGGSEAEVMARQLAELQIERQQLHSQLQQRDEVLKVAAGHQRAAHRQLANVQAQYAAVAGLRDRYEALQRELTELQETDNLTHSTDEADGEQLRAAETAIEELHAEAKRLRNELTLTREQIRYIDPIETDAGRRWVMLVAALVTVLAVAILTLVMALRAVNADQTATSVSELSGSTTRSELQRVVRT